MRPQTPDQILAAHRLTRCGDDTQLAQGFLNTVHVAQDAAGQKYVLRIGRDENREDIEQYITRQIKFLGAADLGGALHYRSIPAQAEFMQSLTDAGIHTPAIAAHGGDWMLMHFAEGRSLSKRFAAENPEAAANAAGAVLNALIDVHKKGICLWDRWGGNELIDDKLNVCFIDFDLQISFPGNVPVKTQTALDLAFMLRGCLQFSLDAEVTAAALADTITRRSDFAQIYDVKSLVRFIDGQVNFYDAEYCNKREIAPDTARKHMSENKLMRELQNHIHAHAPATTRFTPRKNTP